MAKPSPKEVREDVARMARGRGRVSRFNYPSCVSSSAGHKMAKRTAWRICADNGW